MADIEYPLYFIRRDGAVWTAETPETAAGCSAERQHRVVVRSHDWEGVILSEHVVEATWIARDALGRVVTNDQIPDAPRKRMGWHEKRMAVAREAADRGLPIPGTGKGRMSRGPFARTAPYIGEMRDARAQIDDLAEAGLQDRLVVKLRALGPDPYEDPALRRTERCWKTQRRTKWKA